MKHTEPFALTVASVNMLHDVTRTNAGLILPQDERVMAAAASLVRFDGDLDVVAVQEAYESKRQHNGRALARASGMGDGHWAVHNTKPPDSPNRKTGRSGENVGLMGDMVREVVEIDIGGRRKALLTQIAGIAFVAAHLRAGVSLAARRERREGARAIIAATRGYDGAVIALDKNEFRIPVVAAAQGAFDRAGFVSAYELSGTPQPTTFPTDAYKPVYGRSREFALDDILVRGERIEVTDAGCIDQVCLPYVAVERYADAPLAPSDHRWPYARLHIYPQI